jgi:hypothetical protein
MGHNDRVNVGLAFIVDGKGVGGFQNDSVGGSEMFPDPFTQALQFHPKGAEGLVELAINARGQQELFGTSRAMKRQTVAGKRVTIGFLSDMMVYSLPGDGLASLLVALTRYVPFKARRNSGEK